MGRSSVRAGAILVVAGLLVVLSLAGVWRALTFDGDLVGLLRSDSRAQERFTSLETAFQPFSSDEILLLEADDLSRPDRFEALQAIVIDLHFVPGVLGVLSVFSLPGPDDASPSLAAASGAQAADLLAALDAVIPEGAPRLMSRDHSMALVVVMPEDRTGLSPEARAEVHDLVAWLRGGAISATFVGLPEAYCHLQTAPVQDQLRLIPFAVLASVLVAGLPFLSWRAAALCVGPPLVAVVLLMGVAHSPACRTWPRSRCRGWSWR